MRGSLTSGLDHALYGLARTHIPSGGGWRQTRAIAQFTRHHLPPDRFLAMLTGASAGDVRTALAEAHAALAAYPWPHGKGGQVSQSDWTVLYTAARLLRPWVVVETGTGSGASTSAIAAALEAVGRGVVASIDVAPGSTLRGADGVPYTVPDGQTPGWAIPPDLRARASLILDDVRNVLPHHLARVADIGMVFLDDDHTPEHVAWEVKTAWAKLPTGGVVLCDDANYGWADTMLELGREPYTNCGMLAGCRKP